MNPVTRTFDLVRRFLTNSWRLLTSRREGRETSPTGIALQVCGLVAFLFGIHLFSPALAYITGGALAVYVGERL